jgi:hypothetical protein
VDPWGAWYGSLSLVTDPTGLVAIIVKFRQKRPSSHRPPAFFYFDKKTNKKDAADSDGSPDFPKYGSFFFSPHGVFVRGCYRLKNRPTSEATVMGCVCAAIEVVGAGTLNLTGSLLL